MAATFKLAELFTDLTVRDAALAAGLSRARAQIAATHAAMSSLATRSTTMFLGGLGGALGLTAGAIGLVKLLDTAVKLDFSMKGLEFSMKETGHASKEAMKDIQSFSESMREQLGISAEVSRGLLSYALNVGASTTESKELTKAAVGLSQALRVDVETAMKIATKAAQGNFTAIDRQLPIIRNLATEEEKLAKINEIATRGIRERTQMLNSAEGALIRLQVSLQNVASTVGQVLLPALADVADWISTITKMFTAGTADWQIRIMSTAASLLKLKAGLMFLIPGQNGQELADLLVQIKNLEDGIKAVQDQATKEAIKKDNELAKVKIKNMKDVEEKAKNSFRTVEQIWEDAQNDSLKQMDAFNAGKTFKDWQDKQKRARRIGQLGGRADIGGAVDALAQGDVKAKVEQDPALLRVLGKLVDTLDKLNVGLT